MHTPFDRLVAIEEIKKLKARYFRCLDMNDWSRLSAVFAADAVFDLRKVNSMRHSLTRDGEPAPGGDEKVFVGRDTIVSMIRASIKDLYTVHHAHMPETEIQSSTTASGMWPMEDTLRYASGELLLKGTGYYEETYVKVGGSWQIKTSQLSRLFVDGALGVRPNK